MVVVRVVVFCVIPNLDFKVSDNEDDGCSDATVLKSCFSILVTVG